jgi:polar amino acid transport system substrate-binding protein
VDAIKKEEAVFKSFKELKTFGDNVTALMDLTTGRLEAVVVDEVVGRYYVAKKPGDYAVLDDNFGTEEYGVGLRKDDTDLHGKIDKALADMKQDGAAAKIAEQWFGKNIIK